jgi:hypothetical protein
MFPTAVFLAREVGANSQETDNSKRSTKQTQNAKPNLRDIRRVAKRESVRYIGADAAECLKQHGCKNDSGDPGKY